MSVFYDTMQKMGYMNEPERKKPGFESFIKKETNFDIVIFFYFNERKMKGYVIPKMLFTDLRQVMNLKEYVERMEEDVKYLSSLSKYDIIK